MNDSENKRTAIGSFGKFGLISHITEKAVLQNKSTVSGAGDDSAIIDSGDDLTLVSTDLMLEGIHFNLIYNPLKHLGYKAVIRAISDIYANCLVQDAGFITTGSRLMQKPAKWLKNLKLTLSLLL
jgi:thiamine-monophosphate kinase